LPVLLYLYFFAALLTIMLQQITPWFGYFASLCLIIALLVNNDLKFRWFNTCGNIFFISYAIILQAYPVLITNVVLMCINLVYLVKVYRKKEKFNLLEFKGDEKLAQHFLEFYQEDIRAYFPAFEASALPGKLNFVVTRNLVIANMFSAQLLPNGDAQVLLNYTVPRYRDYKVGRFIFDKENHYLAAKGVKRLVYTTAFNKQHKKFLLVMGFTEQSYAGQYQMVKLLQQTAGA
jgi:hypothetical protein